MTSKLFTNPDLDAYIEDQRVFHGRMAELAQVPLNLSDPEGVRRARTPNPLFAGPPVDVVTESMTVSSPGGPVGVRVIRPPEAVRGVYLDIHGGGFYTGRPAMNDPWNGTLAANLGLCTVSVEYRLAPECPHPAAENDCLAVAEWLLEGSPALFGSDRLVLGGASAGGTLAVQTLLRLGAARDRFVGVNLVSGLFDLSGTPSARRQGIGFLDAYLPGLSESERRVPQISPLYGELGGMPPALFSAGTADFLIDDTLLMEARWREAANETALDLYPEAVHGFERFPTEMAAAANCRIEDWIRRRLEA